jgi:hypothetical protein
MTRRPLLAACAFAVAFGFAACGGDDEAGFSERTLTFTEQETGSFGFADNPPTTELGEQGPRKLSSGDEITFSSELLDGSQEPMGALEISCSVTRPGGFADSHLHCTGTATLADGSLTLARGGRVFAGTDASGAVLGGTGSYAAATGEFTESEGSGGGTTYTLHIHLPER